MSFSHILAGALQGTIHFPLCLVSWQPGAIWEPDKDSPPPSQQLQGKLPGEKGKKITEVSQYSASALPMCALLDRVQHFESNMHKTLMSREELVSQKSLKYDHM